MQQVQKKQQIGRSKGGLSTKLHAGCDKLGNSVRFCLTAGQKSDYTKTFDLLSGKKKKILIAGKGYDSDTIINTAKK